MGKETRAVTEIHDLFEVLVLLFEIPHVLFAS